MRCDRDEYLRESAFYEMKEFREPVLTRNEGNKPIFSVEMETIKKVPVVGESQCRAFRGLGKNENLTSIELPAQYCEQSSSHDRVAPDSKDVRTLPSELPSNEIKLLVLNPGWAPISSRNENRVPPVTQNGEMHQSSRIEDSQHPYQMNIEDPRTLNHRHDYETLIENNPAVGRSARAMASQSSPNEKLARALHQVVNMPKIEYLRFNGDPLKYGTFMHNFEACLERDNPDDSRNSK